MNAVAVRCIPIEHWRWHVDCWLVHVGVRLLLVAHVGHVAAVLVSHVIGHHLPATIRQVNIVGALQYIDK